MCVRERERDRDRERQKAKEREKERERERKERERERACIPRRELRMPSRTGGRLAMLCWGRGKPPALGGNSARVSQLRIMRGINEASVGAASF